MKKLKKNKKVIFVFILGVLLMGTTSVLAATYYASKDVTYDNSESGMTSENVQDAIDELYDIANSNLSTSDLLIEQTVTSGNGLYSDIYEKGKYIYRGSNPDNYLIFNNETWRIISVNMIDNTIKIVRSNVLENKEYDKSGNRTTDSSNYCNYSGCNIYGSTSSLHDRIGNAITKLARQTNTSTYNLPINESSLSTYLNGIYYNDLNSEAKKMIIDGEYKSAPVGLISMSNIITQMWYASEAIWKGKVGLIDATEYARASLGSNINSDNWMNIGDTYWTMSPYSHTDVRFAWVVKDTGDFDYQYVTRTSAVRPVVTLSSSVKITDGDGSENNAYQLSL